MNKSKKCISLLLAAGLICFFGCQKKYGELPKFRLEQTGIRSYEIHINGKAYSTIENPIWYPEESRAGEVIGTCDFNGTVLVYQTSTEHCVFVENQKSTLSPVAELFGSSFIQPKLSETEIASIRYETYENRYQGNEDYIEISDLDTIKRTISCISDEESEQKIGLSDSKPILDWIGVAEFRSDSLPGMVATVRIMRQDDITYYALRQSGSELICINGQGLIPSFE